MKYLHNLMFALRVISPSDLFFAREIVSIFAGFSRVR